MCTVLGTCPVAPGLVLYLYFTVDSLRKSPKYWFGTLYMVHVSAIEFDTILTLGTVQ